MEENDDQDQIFDGISEIMGDLSERHAKPLNDKMSLKVKHFLVQNGQKYHSRKYEVSFFTCFEIIKSEKVRTSQRQPFLGELTPGSGCSLLASEAW